MEQLMEEKKCYPIPKNEETAEVITSTRGRPPSHYTLKVETFSQFSEILSKAGVEKYESDSFEAGGYKWKLSLYPNGRKERNANGYISLYLVIEDTDTLPLGWEVYVIFKFFLFDQIHDNYLIFQDGNGQVNRFHGMKTECGFAQLLSLDTLKNASNGYLVDDSCIFGAEVFVIKSTGKGECVSMVKISDNNSYTWKLREFSRLNEEKYSSEVFKSGDQEWKLSIYPNGLSSQRGKYLSLNIHLVDWGSFPPERKLYAEYTLRITDQTHGQHSEIKDTACFSPSNKGWTYKAFLGLNDLYDMSRGYLVNDTLIVEAQIEVISTVKNFS